MTHFLQLIKDLKVQPNTILVTVDVNSLYTNIQHGDDIEAIRECLTRNNEDAQVTNFTCQLLEHVLTKNYFTFNDKQYIKTSGTAMGTRCALNYAILFMAVLGDKFLAQQSTKPMVWKRYINDIFMIWDHTETELDHFLDKLNNYHPTIKFTKKNWPQ